ncbi:MAG: PAS domain-containing protein [Verrucomicrobia subdivision 3 bacterium]|nr:PAS domain-containing protein [Limisphaerales bacterium]
MNSSAAGIDWDESPSARKLWLKHTGGVFESLFERSFDAVWLFDPKAGVFVDCNQAAVKLLGAENKHPVSCPRFTP